MADRLVCELAAVNAGVAALSCSGRSLDPPAKAASTDVRCLMRLSPRIPGAFFELAACNTLAFFCAWAWHRCALELSLETDIYEHFLAA